ncbi:uncharacterized protein L199_004159 [Kwoniella botswanensis]|uniref:uncharacterized protein n=1 Tax=Kwoniella botswanensis TaxID=1268659 RepID=UPI00315CAA8A
MSSGHPGKEEERVDVEEVGSENSSEGHEGEGGSQTEEGQENTGQSVRFTEDTDFTTKSTYTRNKKGRSRRGGSSEAYQGSIKTLNFLSGYSRR